MNIPKERDFYLPAKCADGWVGHAGCLNCNERDHLEFQRRSSLYHALKGAFSPLASQIFCHQCFTAHFATRIVDFVNRSPHNKKNNDSPPDFTKLKTILH